MRAYARYLKQIRLGFDLGYIASTLNNHTDIARELTRLFKTRFYLARKLAGDDLDDKQQRLEQAILTALDDVQVLNEDRILRPLPGPDQGHPCAPTSTSRTAMAR